jgi:mitochondrial import inner membrane translocase subunit TIM50
VEAHARAQPDNAIILSKWKGDPKDKSLVGLIPFLEFVAITSVNDVRPVLQSFEGKDIAIEFAKREKTMRQEFEKGLAEEQAKKPRHGVSSLISLLGLKRSVSLDGEISPVEGLEQGKMFWDQLRERGQKNYLILEKEIQETGEQFLADVAAEEEKAMQEHMKGIKGSLTGFFGFGGNPSK